MSLGGGSSQRKEGPVAEAVEQVEEQGRDRPTDLLRERTSSMGHMEQGTVVEDGEQQSYARCWEFPGFPRA